MSIKRVTESGYNCLGDEFRTIFVSDGAGPFETAVIGITYPFASYRIRRGRNTRINLFEYVLEGEGQVLIDGKWHRATAGDVYVLPAGMHHEYRADSKNPR